MWADRHRALVATATALVLCVAMASCTPTESTGSEEPHMTPREGRDKVVELVINSTKQLDVTGWAPRIVAWAQGCGTDGAAYGYDQWAPAGTDLEGDARRVGDYWKSLGMSVRITDTTPYPTVYGEGGPVLRAAFDTALGDFYHIDAIAYCEPGDAYELNVQDEAERDAGKVLPGDEGLIPNPDNQPPTPAPVAP